MDSVFDIETFDIEVFGQDEVFEYEVDSELFDEKEGLEYKVDEVFELDYRLGFAI